VRCPARDLQPDSDLGALPVTRDVGELSRHEIDGALAAGAISARKLLAAGLIEGAALRLKGELIVVGPRKIEPSGFRAAVRGPAVKGALHA
jgi:uncharacterized protein